MKRSIVSVLVASVLVLTGCGASEEEEAKTAISEFLMKQQAQDRMVKMSEGEADCMADDMVDGIGVDKLTDYGFLEEDGSVAESIEAPEMSQKDSETMVDALFECTDVMNTMKEQFAASMQGQPAEVKECFDKALTEEMVRGLLLATFTGDQDQAGQELLAPMMECAGAATGLPQE